MNAYTPRSALFAAAVHFLPHVSPKSLGQLDEAEERPALTHAIRLAEGLAKQLTEGGWTVALLLARALDVCTELNRLGLVFFGDQAERVKARFDACVKCKSGVLGIP